MRWVPAALLSIVLAATGEASRAQASLPSALPSAIERAQVLIREGNPEQAWRLLSPLEKQYAGRPDFDLALAIAATDSGRPNLATFALERVVVVEPGNTTARLELVRAFHALGDYERARRELRFLLGGNPPAEVRALAAQYEEKMSGQTGAALRAAGWSGYAEAGLGHDSNASVATAQANIFVPSLGGDFLIDRAFLQERDRFAALGAGVEYAQPLSPVLAATLGAELQTRAHAKLDRFDSRTADLHAVLHQRLDLRDSVQYALRHNDYELDHAGYRRMQSGAVEWRRSLGDYAQVGVGAQGYRIRYRQEEAANSSDLVVLSASAAYVFDPASRKIGFAGVYLGMDNAVAGRADGDRRIYGASAGLQRVLLPGVEGYASLALLYSRYATVNPDFALRRHDRQVDLALGVSWQLTDGWFLRPQVSRTRHGSDIPVHEYGRTEVSLSLRREWN